MKDTLYRSSSTTVKPFEFNQMVVDVFPDMIQRSVPGYTSILAMIGVIANNFFREHTNIYDLGCSLGGVSFAISQSIGDQQCTIMAVDNSDAMITACRKHVPENNPNVSIEYILQDIQETNICNASVVVMNFTLQFIPLDQRLALLEKVYTGLLPGGALILSEKVIFSDPRENKHLDTLHQHMKQLNGYKTLEIAAKREALDRVLLPESVADHQERLRQVGFNESLVWWQYFNFVSLLAVK